MIQGISHITFIVADLERAAKFFKDVFDAKEVYASGEKTFSLSKERFFVIGGQWIALMEGDPLKERSYHHVAFQIAEDDFARYEERIVALGIERKRPRSRVDGEGRSLYFYDFDNHLFELHTGTLEKRLERYAK
ncbi:FosX/FosE/FosI family fosfomycin resistance hydrolase [Azotosporobacter soli]|uniref:FosX/FosE/FosI family fosfomycin resistance hydrolase n=1 Tax=Azotosporobacter soli TaxID=3055040 RepID=UPI003D160EFC